MRDITSMAGFCFFAFFIPFAMIINKAYGFKLFIGIASGYAITILIRLFYFKDRPEPKRFSNIIEKIDASSFPSLHSLNATVFTVISIYFLHSIYAYILFAFYLPLILFSRYYLKKHYWIDIFFGAVFGTLIAVLVLL